MRAVFLALATAAFLVPAAAGAGEPAVVSLSLKDHRFTPQTVTVPAGQPIVIELANEDGALEEFDSEDLGVEQDVTPHGHVRFTVGPLKPGRYEFMGELHADTASGVLQAVEAP